MHPDVLLLCSLVLYGSQEVLNVARHVSDTAMAPPPASNCSDDGGTTKEGENEEEGEIPDEDKEEESEFAVDTTSRQYIKYSQMMANMKVTVYETIGPVKIMIGHVDWNHYIDPI